MAPATKNRGVSEQLDVINISPKVGDQVYSKFINREWYWGVVEKKFWKYGDWCFSIQYDDGDYLEELKTKDGIATVAQFNNDPMFAKRRASAPPPPSSSSSSYDKEFVDEEFSMEGNKKRYSKVKDVQSSTLSTSDMPHLRCFKHDSKNIQ